MRWIAPALVAVFATAGAVHAEDPIPAEPARATIPKATPSLFFILGLGPAAAGTENFHARTPNFTVSAGGSIPIARKVCVDLGLGFSFAQYREEPLEATWSGDAFLESFSLVAAFRAGHAGSKVALYGSAGIGLAYVRLGEPGGFGVYPEPVGSTTAPVVTVAGSLEPLLANKRTRFVIEMRYSWINADLGAAAGGSVNVGGAALGFGWRGGV